MYSIKSKLASRVVVVGRRLFFHTYFGKTDFAGKVVKLLFKFYSPDLLEPVSFRTIRLYVDQHDRSYVPGVVGGYYEKLELDIFSELCKKSSVFFDIGANIGMYSIVAENSNKKIRSYAFEPTPGNVSLLKKNKELNNMKKIAIIESAVSEKVGNAKISLGTSGSGTNSLSVDYGGEYLDVKTISVDEFCLKKGIRPDLVKIDVEGHENYVLKGAVRTIKGSQVTIFIEYIPKMNKEIKRITKYLAGVSKGCYVVDDVRGTIEKISSDKLNTNESYNLIFSNNPAHIELIEAFQTI